METAIAPAGGDEDGAGEGVYPELPPEVGSPPGVDRAAVRTFLAARAHAYASAGIPDQDTPLGAAFPAERAVESTHHVVQRRIAKWAPTARAVLDGVLASRHRDLHRQGREVGRLDANLEDRREGLEAADTALASTSPGRRFATEHPGTVLVAPIGAALLEYPVVEPVVGHFFDVANETQFLATLAVIVLQVAVCELAGAALRAWKTTTSAQAERRTVATGALLALTLTVVMVAAITGIRLDTMARGEVATALPLFVGLQGALALLSGASGWYAAHPDVLTRRQLARDVARVETEVEAARRTEDLLTQQVHHLEELIADWGHWTQRHKEETSAACTEETRRFRDRLVELHCIASNSGAAHRVLLLADPTFPIPIDDADLDEDDDLIDPSDPLGL